MQSPESWGFSSFEQAHFNKENDHLHQRRLTKVEEKKLVLQTKNFKYENLQYHSHYCIML